MRLAFTVPMRVVSEANVREHYMAKARRAKAQRAAMLMAMRCYGRGAKLKPPFVVMLTRIGVRDLDDDNLARAFKAVRDSVAEALGVDDGDTRKVMWTYRQERGKPREYAVMVQVY